MVFIVVTACPMATHLLRLGKSYKKNSIVAWPPLPSCIQDLDSQVDIVQRFLNHHQSYRREAKLLHHPPLPPYTPSHKSFAGLWKLHNFLPMGRLNAPQDVFICATSSAHRHSNSQHTKCIRKAANTKRIATTYHVPSKNKTLSHQ